MRKVLLLNVLALTLFSCAVEEVATNKTTSISVIATPEAKASSLTGKDVKRGNIYAWVKDITLTASSNVIDYSVTDTFNLVDNSTPGNVADAGVFRLNSVAIGSNTLLATSTTNAVGEESLTISRDTPTKVLKDAVDRNPYAVYSSGNITKDIQETPNSVITVPMNTNNGRIITVFSIADATVLKSFDVTVEAIIGSNRAGLVTLTSGDVARFYFSNAAAIRGVKVVYNVKFVNKKTHVIETVVLNSTVEASTSYSCNYVVNTGNKLYKEEVKFNFEFQKWNETTCPTCPGN
jgi:hypothetical protein